GRRGYLVRLGRCLAWSPPGPPAWSPPRQPALTWLTQGGTPTGSVSSSPWTRAATSAPPGTSLRRRSRSGSSGQVGGGRRTGRGRGSVWRVGISTARGEWPFCGGLLLRRGPPGGRRLRVRRPDGEDRKSTRL